MVHSPDSNIFLVNLNADQYGEFNLSGLIGHVSCWRLFSFAMFAILFSPYFPLVFLQPSLHTTLKHFRKFITRLQRSKGIRLSTCFRIVKVFGLPMEICNCTPPSSLKVSL